MPKIADFTDRALVQIFLLTREEWAFRLLYRRHGEVVWRLALRLGIGSREDAEDVAQEAWLRAIERLPQFRWESSLRTWLVGFVVMRWRERWRSMAVREKYFAPLDSANGSATAADFQIEILDLEAALAALPSGFRAVLTLHDIEGFRHDEIAELLGISIGTSKSQLSRARAAVRKNTDF